MDNAHVVNLSRKDRFKNVVLSMDNYLKLKTLGHAGDSFNDVITTLTAEHSGGNSK